MIARYQRLLLLITAVSTLAWIWWCQDRGYPIWWGMAWPMTIVAVYLGALALEFAWLRGSFEPLDPDRPTDRALGAAWWWEALVGLRVFAWQQPFRSRKIADLLAPPLARPGHRGIVFVHGFFCNRGIWNRWMKRCRQDGRPFVAVDLEPVFGSIDDYGDTIDAAVERLRAATGRAPLIVAHSMGGLAVRAWLAARRDVAVHGVVTIATPHRGTWMARHSRRVNAAQMATGGAWLSALERSEAETAGRGYTCFWSECDNIVFPVRGATLPAARNIQIAGVPHVALLFERSVIETVLEIADGGTDAASDRSTDATVRASDPPTPPAAAIRSPPATG